MSSRSDAATRRHGDAEKEGQLSRIAMAASLAASSRLSFAIRNGRVYSLLCAKREFANKIMSLVIH
jgi:hypothetical protein